MYDFSLIIKNNTGSPVELPLLNPSGIRGTFNSPTNFTADLSGADFNVPEISITVRSNATTEFTTYNVALVEKNIAGVLAALNSLGIGVFWISGNSIVTSNSLYTYGNLIIGDPTNFDLPFTVNATPGARTFTIVSSGGLMEGSIDWGDGTVDNFSSNTNVNIVHNYLVAGVYNGGVTFTPASLPNVDNLVFFSAELTSLTGLEKLVNLNALTLNFNQLTSIDVTQNLTLSNISIFSNNLTSLDLSNNTDLSGISAANNNLATVNLPATASLGQLVLNNNNLTTLDVSANVGLLSLVINNNDLTVAPILVSNVILNTVNIRNNQLSVASVNTTLIDIDAHGNNNGTLVLDLQTPAAPPSGAGAAAALSLTGKGWIVFVD